MTTWKQILIILDNFEINSIGALFPPGTAVAGDWLAGVVWYANKEILHADKNSTPQVFAW